MFDHLGAWLIDQGLREAPVDDVVQGFGRGLVEAGVSIYRISLGGLLLHPVYGALDIVWNAHDDSIINQMMPRNVVTTETFQKSPFFWAMSNRIVFHRFTLGAGLVTPEFPIFERLRDEGVTDYLLLFESYNRTTDAIWADLPAGMEGVILSVSTRRKGGFAELEIAYLKAMMRPLALTIKSSTTHQLSRALLDTYLGSYTGNRVLEGVVERGDGGIIDCVLFYCDLRNSTKLAEALPLDRYLALINDYFDCTAGAVADHGGEVLKFIGDAVMAIFPVNAQSRPAVDMCRAAINAARDAFDCAAAIGTADNPSGQAFSFGVSLHMGQVMYGNVGTERRLDFTVIGPAVNQATRLEGLCKSMGVPIVLSEGFEAHYAGDVLPLGKHSLPGLDQGIEVYTLPEFAAR
jgi:adenylate cyclase